MTLEEARRVDPEAEVGGEVRTVRTPIRSGASPRKPPSRSFFRRCARPSARRSIQRVFRPRWRAGELHDQARRRSGPDRRSGQDRGPIAEEGAVQAESFSVGERVRCVIKASKEPGNRRRQRVARRAGTGDAAVRAGSAGDLRRHCHHQGMCAGSRRAHQDCGAEPRSGRR